MGRIKPERSESWQIKTKRFGNSPLENRFRGRRFHDVDRITRKDNLKERMKADINRTVQSETPNELPEDPTKQILFRTEPARAGSVLNTNFEKER
jgi:hypothetical protein